MSDADIEPCVFGPTTMDLFVGRSHMETTSVDHIDDFEELFHHKLAQQSYVEWERVGVLDEMAINATNDRLSETAGLA
ncbi:hypothetical protein [Natronobacterium gregoryi]|uniref:hypothetical protein n=1 Tax=Natronobacterium gregoryi TaxID=44930 RepID=UPI0009D9E51A|nr:hypothetical protein [Natronobacterium gregoryi]